MWKASSTAFNGGRGHQVTLFRSARPLTRAEVIAGWRDDEAFRAWFIGVLAQSPFPAYFWETPPITRASLDEPFESVLLDSPALAATTADPTPFAQHFRAAGRGVACFPNLGGDAFLIAPCPRAADGAYLHLGAFTREAPADQQQELWQLVGQAVTERLGTRPLWVSTAGLGVFWLHLRLDSSPKYYRYRAYAESTWDST